MIVVDNLESGNKYIIEMQLIFWHGVSQHGHYSMEICPYHQMVF